MELFTNPNITLTEPYCHQSSFRLKIMRLRNADKILTIRKIFWPLFVGTICVTVLGLALVPGRLEARTGDLGIAASIVFVGLPCTILLAGLVIRDIYLLISLKEDIQNIFHLSGIFSLLIIVTTALLLHFDIPPRICFYTYAQQFDRSAREQQILSDGVYKNIRQIGGIEIDYTLVQQINVGNKQEKHIYFGTQEVDRFLHHSDDYGFAYLPHLSQNEMTATISLHHDWYIFLDVEHNQRGFIEIKNAPHIK